MNDTHRKIKAHATHQDQRGYFKELLRLKDYGESPLSQISIFTINPGFSRGGHYHCDTTETFILLNGDCLLALEESNKDTTFVRLNEGEPCQIYPPVKHTFDSVSGCTILVISSREFDKENPDTYVER